MVTKRYNDEVDGMGDDRLHESKRQNTVGTGLSGLLRGPSVEEFVDTLIFCVRKVVREEMECQILSKLQPSQRPSVNQIAASRPKGFRLHFMSRLPNMLFTGSRILAEGSAPVEVVILDANSKIVRTGPLSSLKIEIVALDGDFGTDEQEDWSEKEFSESMIREREGKRPLVIGEVLVTLNKGVGYLSDISVTDNSSWIRSGKFKLGARVVRNCNNERIREARTGAFVVRDHRGQGYQKHYPPLPNDEVWRLKKIRKDGVFHQRLASMGIGTVQDFLRLFFTDSSTLLKAFGNGISSKTWEAIIRHAKTCTPDNRMFGYSAGSEHGLMFNSFFEVIGGTFDGGQTYMPLSNIPSSQMILVESLKKYAYKHQNEIVQINWPPAHVLSSVPLPLQGSSIPEPTLDVQLTNFQIRDQDHPAIHLGLNNIFNPIPNVFEDHCHFQDGTVMAAASNQIEECFQFQSNNFTMTGEMNGNVVTNDHLSRDFNFSQVQTPIYFPLEWEDQGDETYLTPGSNQTGIDFFSSNPNVSLVHINRNWKPRTGWFKIRAAVKFLCQKKSKNSSTATIMNHRTSYATALLNL